LALLAVRRSPRLALVVDIARRERDDDALLLVHDREAPIADPVDRCLEPELHAGAAAPRIAVIRMRPGDTVLDPLAVVGVLRAQRAVVLLQRAVVARRDVHEPPARS